jgi:hypothetical protein
MVAVIYGYIPVATIEKLLKLPPENIFKNPSTLPIPWLLPSGALTPEMRLVSLVLISLEIPGSGTWAITLKITRTPSVKIIFRRKSGIPNALTTAFHMVSSVLVVSAE